MVTRFQTHPAGNHNVAWRAVEVDSDILNLNDDVYFLEPDPVTKLQSLVYSEPRIGCVSAYVKIGFFGNPIQCKPRQDVPISFVKTSSNGCGYFRREMINEVGYFDETFNEPYSAEDADYTYRINLAGWKVGIARDVPVKHGFQNSRSTSTSRRTLGQSINEHNKLGIAKFEAKHGGPFREKVHGFWDWMPAKAKRGCKQCGVLTDSTYCPAHAGLAKRYDAERSKDPIRKLFNTVRWHWVRKTVLARDRICVICKSWAAEECDHVIPARKYIAQHGGDMNRFYDESNLAGLCKPCHSRKTATEDGGGWQQSQ